MFMVATGYLIGIFGSFAPRPYNTQNNDTRSFTTKEKYTVRHEVKQFCSREMNLSKFSKMLRVTARH